MAVITILAILGGALAMASSFPPTARELQYRSNKLWTNREQEAMELMELARRGHIDTQEAYKRLEAHGFDITKSQELLMLTNKLMEVDELVVLFRRGIIEKAPFERRMSQLGYDSIEADLVLQTREYLPAPSDLVRFAVREVYTPEVVKEYKLDEAFPERFAEEALKVGMGRDQAINFWRAHWELPSLTMGFQMFHRGELLEGELDTLMRIQDVMPYFRDKLKAIAYSPYTRVDVRRMYEVGVLKKEDLIKAYMDLGYDEDKATNLMEFTVRYAMPKERDLTRSMIEKAWLQGEVTREEAETYLVTMGYDADEASLIMELKENQVEEDELEDALDVIKLSLTSGVYDFDEALEKLDNLNLKASYRDKIYATLVKEKEKQKQVPTKVDLRDMLKAGVITADEWVEFMKRLGYSKDLRKLYYKLFTTSELEDS